jgi:nicotinamidase-related amidase
VWLPPLYLGDPAGSGAAGHPVGLARRHGDLDAVPGAELGHEVGDVGLDGAEADVELMGELGVAAATGGGRGTISSMQHAFGLDVPESVAEMCQPPRVAVLVYDAQVGILPHVGDWDLVLTQIRSVVEAARGAGVPVLYVRHVSVPPSHMGVGALRTAMAWQRVERAEDVKSSFPHDASHTQLVDELKPEAGEPVFDKLGMSAFVGTPLEVVLRDRGVITLILVGAVLEIGIEPTARHAADLGFLPVVVEDACGVVEGEAAERSMASLDYSLMSYRATTAQVVEALSGA